MNTRSFAAHGSDAFNAWMEEKVQRIASAVENALRENLHALVLGGGYGRGEGGVVRTSAGERPYNDLDFVLVVRRREPGISERLAPVSQQFGLELGIDVDFSRPLTEGDIRRWPHWLMWHDLLMAHRVVIGPGDVLTANAPASLREQPPLTEATRLLLNRGAGLLWSLRIARDLEKAHDEDFLRRNLHKCELAIGDSVIMTAKRHQARYTGREGLLREILAADSDELSFVSEDAYKAALAFRLAPSEAASKQPTEDDLLRTAERWSRAFMHLESCRTGGRFADASAYTAWAGIRESELHGLKHVLPNFARNLKLGRCSLRYPRERLFRALPGLITGSSPRWADESARFLTEWRRYN